MLDTILPLGEVALMRAVVAQALAVVPKARIRATPCRASAPIAHR